MENIWNNFELKKPPFVTLPAKHSNFVLKIHAAIDNYFSKHGQHEQQYNEAAALLSRLIARRKNSFYKMKGFKDVCKLNAALCRLLRVDFNRDLEHFRSALPDVEYDEGTIIQLPTRDSFDFVLLRLIAIYELYRRINDCCLSAAEYFTCQMRLYFFFEINTLLLSVLAKIHYMTIKLLNFAVELYNNILPHRLKLPVNKNSTFSKNFQSEFPSKLEETKLTALGDEISAVKDQPLNVLLHDEEKLAPVKAQKLKKADLGKYVDRSPNPEQKVFQIEKLNSVEAIKQFIFEESKSRSKNLSKCITSKILSHEWAGATKLFERKIYNGEARKAVNIFCKFLSLKIL